MTACFLEGEGHGLPPWMSDEFEQVVEYLLVNTPESWASIQHEQLRCSHSPARVDAAANLHIVTQLQPPASLAQELTDGASTTRTCTDVMLTESITSATLPPTVLVRFPVFAISSLLPALTSYGTGSRTVLRFSKQTSKLRRLSRERAVD
jgi:hypothetical protein